MLLAGDEVNNSQVGNNNAYCQDNEISWLDWQPSTASKRLLAFTQHLIKLRKQHPLLNRSDYQHGLNQNHYGLPDIAWLGFDGYTLSQQQWDDPETRTFAMLLGKMPADDNNCAISDDVLIIIFNGESRSLSFTLPDLACDWCLELDTMKHQQHTETLNLSHTNSLPVAASSCIIISGRHNVNASHVILERCNDSPQGVPANDKTSFKDNDHG